MFKARELAYHLNDSGAKVLVCLEGLYRDVAKEVVPDTDVEHVFTTSELDFLPEGASYANLMGAEKLRSDETEDFMAVLEQEPSDSSVREAVAPDDIAYLVYTSGTTGRPKGRSSCTETSRTTPGCTRPGCRSGTRTPSWGWRRSSTSPASSGT